MKYLGLIAILATGPLLCPQTSGASAPDLAVGATVTPDQPVPGGSFLVALIVTTTNDAHHVTVKGSVPANTTFESVTAPANWDCQTPQTGEAGAINCSTPTLSSATKALLSLTFVITPGTPPDVEITSSFAVTSDEPDGNCVNNTAAIKLQLTPQELPLLKWLRTNVSVRRTFDGSKEENKPANITWVGRDATNGRDFWDVNVALKVLEIPLGTHNRPEALVVYPVIEWHRQNTVATPVNKGSAKLGVEWFPMALSKDTVVPFAVGNVQYIRDWEKPSWSTSANLLLGLWSKKSWLPGANSRFLDRTQMLRYYVYLGAEYYDKLPVVAGEPLFTGLWKVSGEWNWLSSRDPTYRMTQVLMEYTLRRRLAGSYGINRRLSLEAVEANIYLNRKANVAIGYRYQRGDDPVKDFAFNEQSSVGLKVKF